MTEPVQTRVSGIRGGYPGHSAGTKGEIHRPC